MLSIKLKPGQRIEIGGGITIDVVLDSGRKLALRISAPRDQSIQKFDPDESRGVSPDLLDNNI